MSLSGSTILFTGTLQHRKKSAALSIVKNAGASTIISTAEALLQTCTTTTPTGRRVFVVCGKRPSKKVLEKAQLFLSERKAHGDANDGSSSLLTVVTIMTEVDFWELVDRQQGAKEEDIPLREELLVDADALPAKKKKVEEQTDIQSAHPPGSSPKTHQPADHILDHDIAIASHNKLHKLASKKKIATIRLVNPSQKTEIPDGLLRSLPPNITHIVIDASCHCVERIGKFFLHWSHVETIDFSGFCCNSSAASTNSDAHQHRQSPTRLKVIDSGFLERCSALKLQETDFSPLRGVQKVGYGFMSWLGGQEEGSQPTNFFSFLSDIHTIGDSFLRGNRWSNVDLSPLQCVRHIGDYFMCEMPNLKSVALPRMTSNSTTNTTSDDNTCRIGGSFLACGVALESIDLAPLRGVEQVGDLFLAYCDRLLLAAEHTGEKNEEERDVVAATVFSVDAVVNDVTVLGDGFLKKQ